MIDDDFPAAHSMDTMWFAVDRDGHVAAFGSGEAGAVPKAAYLGEEYDQLLEQIASAGTRSETIYEVPTGKHAWLQGRSDVIALVGDGVDAAALGATRVRTTAGDGWLFEDITRDVHDDLLRCRGCEWLFVESELPEPARHGLYEYECDSYDLGPYERTRIPATPVLAAQLPSSTIACMVRFEGSFADQAEIQPLGIWPSHTWGDTAPDPATPAPTARPWWKRWFGRRDSEG